MSVKDHELVEGARSFLDDDLEEQIQGDAASGGQGQGRQVTAYILKSLGER